MIFANQDYIRYNQSCTVNGWLQVGGTCTEASGWWGGHDYSWGVRTDVTAGEPVTGPRDDRSSRGGFLWTWITFGAQNLAGHVQYHEEREERRDEGGDEEREVEEDEENVQDEVEDHDQDEAEAR